MKKGIYIFIILIQTSIILNGQDPSFSQFEFNKLYYNPAFAGLSGGVDFSLTPRIEWPNIPGSSSSGTNISGGIQTYKASGDLDISGINGLGGTGLMVVQEFEGQTSLQTTMIGLPIIARPIDFINENNNSRIKLQCGVMISSIFRSINWSKCVFSDQFDPILGIVKTSSFWSNNPSFVEASAIFPDFTPGMVFEWSHKPNTDNFWDLQIGGAVQHITQPQFSFVNLENTIPRLYTIHGNFNFLWTEDVEVSPTVIYQEQASMKTILFGSNLYFYSLFGGIWYRSYQNSDAIIFVAGFRINSENNRCWYFYYSYDCTVSRLINSTFGSHEINVSYKIDNSFLSRDGMKRHNMRRNRNPKKCPKSLYFRPSVVDH